MAKILQQKMRGKCFAIPKASKHSQSLAVSICFFRRNYKEQRREFLLGEITKKRQRMEQSYMCLLQVESLIEKLAYTKDIC
jgi:hypothetical protein